MHLRCPHCQNPIELADLPSAGEITCAGCGSSFQLDQYATATWDGTASKRLGKFELLGTLGQGAFGTVVKARDTELDRIVAIKIPRAGNVGSGAEDVDRFLREARSVAQLRFPSIIAIHEVGADNGTPYLVCDFVEGITLADLLTGRRATFHESAKLLAEIADALQYAHSLGVVHRDVKPSNIMIRPDGSPCVMDFGLAKRDAGEITMTIDGQILGTPAYMSPEQARGEGHRVDGRSDVYSLGVILYQLLTGELPFRGNKVMLLHQVLHDEPKPPRSLNDKIPRDLETIALKALAKEPARRYATAKEMADDLRRWLEGEPITARPIGAFERAWRWCKRNPVLATASGGALAATLAALVTFAAAFFVVSNSLSREQSERKKAETLTLHIQFEHYLSKAEERPDVALVGMASLLQKAARFKNQTLEDSLRLQVGAWSRGAIRLIARCAHQKPARAVELSANGTTALTGSEDKTAQFWDTATGKTIGTPLQHPGEVYDVALSADGKFGLTASHDTVSAWEVATGRSIGSPFHHQGSAVRLALSANGKVAMMTKLDMSILFWDTATGKLIAPPFQFQNFVIAIALSADGKIALAGSLGDKARVLDTATGKLIASPQHEGVVAIALSDDGKLLLTGGSDKTAQLWETTTGKPVGQPIRHQDDIKAVALSDDAKTVLIGGERLAQMWETATSKPLGPPLRFQDRIQQVALRAEGTTAVFATIDKNNVTRLWEVATSESAGTVLPHQNPLNAGALTLDGKVALIGGEDKTARLWDTATGKSMGPQLQDLAPVYGVALSGDGKTALTRTGDNAVTLWDADTGKPIGRPLIIPDVVFAAALSDDAKTVLLGGNHKTAQTWDTATRKALSPLLNHTEPVHLVALNADGRIALTGCREKSAHLWNTITGKAIGPPLQHQDKIHAIALSGDGRMAMTGSDDLTARLWDTTTGKPIGPPLQHQANVNGVALSAEGGFAVSAGGFTARLWETAPGKPIGPPWRHPDIVTSVALSGNGRVVTTLCNDKKVRLWHIPRPMRGDPEHIMLWAQVITGLEVDELTAVKVLDAATWQQRRQRLQELGGPPDSD